MDTAHYHKILRLKMIAMTLFFSLVPLFVLGATIYYQFSEAYRSKMTEDARTLVQNRRNSLELFFNERISQLLTVAHAETLDRMKDETYLAKVFNVMQSRSKSFIDIGVIDEEGNHVAYVGPHHDKLKSVNYAGEPWFHEVWSSGVYISDVFLGFRKIPHFIIAVTTTHGNKTWILRATINSEIIEEIVRQARLGKKGDAFIVNSANILQTSTRFSGAILTRSIGPDYSSVVRTTLEQVDLNGNEYLYACAPTSNPKWVLMVKEDIHEQLTPLLKTRYLEGLVLALGVALVIVGTVLTTRSMTNELMRVQREKAATDDLVMQSSKMAALGKMAAGVAHEINNPLQVISEKAGWMHDLLKDEDVQSSPNFQEFQDCIKKIERQVERCRQITHRMLRFGRRMEPTHEVVDVNHVLKETIAFLANEALHRDIEIEVDFGDDIPRLTTDASQLQQVFLNILDNAIDAVGNFGKIQVRSGVNSSRGSELFVEIVDNGPGMPKEMAKRIFDPFFTTKSPGQGTGLGLSISHSIVEKLGGNIEVDSVQGRGTTFTIRFPTGSLP
ncbi:MAG: ATP-binding protein [Thermodesulfobacteriota bacterium]